MAPSPASEHQAAQADLADGLSVELVSVWRLLDVSQLADTLPRFIAAIAALVRQYGAASATIASDFYTAERAAADIGGRFTVQPAPLPELPQVEEQVRWATRGLWTAEPDPEAIPAAHTLVEGVADRMVTDVGRDTIIDAALRDRKARGWARVPEAHPCAFCAMLAARGHVYRSRSTANFKAHDHERCHVEPVFTAYEPTAEIRRWQRLWDESTRGKSGRAARRAFRAAYEGRDKSGQQQNGGAPGRTRSEIRAELAALKKSHAELQASGANPAAERWQAQRIAKLKSELGE